MLVSVIVIGGMGSLAGAIIGSIYVVGIPALFPANEIVPLLTSSLGLLVLLLYFPGGLANVAYRIRERHLPRARIGGCLPSRSEQRRAPVVDPTRCETPDMPDVTLRTDGIVVTFGGVRANDEISIEVRRNEIVGLIGTNGAGKTTLMNAIGGFVPSIGPRRVAGRGRQRPGAGDAGPAGTRANVPGRHAVPGTHRARHDLGGARGARSQRHGRDRCSSRRGAPVATRAQRGEASELIDFLGLGRYADRPISELSTGTRRIVELGGLLALDAAVLCLDEPTAGIAQREAEAMGPLLVDIRKELERGDAHHRARHAADHEHERSGLLPRTRDGHRRRRPDAVRNDPEVIASYLGMDERTIDRSGSGEAGLTNHPHGRRVAHHVPRMITYGWLDSRRAESRDQDRMVAGASGLRKADDGEGGAALVAGDSSDEFIVVAPHLDPPVRL